MKSNQHQAGSLSIKLSAGIVCNVLILGSTRKLKRLSQTLSVLGKPSWYIRELLFFLTYPMFFYIDLTFAMNVNTDRLLQRVLHLPAVHK